MLELHHLAFRTSDVASLAAFYRDVFGFDVVRESLPASLWLGLGGDAVLMIEARADGESPPAAGSMELVALRADESVRARIREKALERDCFDGETRSTVYLRDPDGRRVGVSTYDLTGG
jgi:catechol 2,3-dioxygenase-like lactoylglutathione lyase family enzyme